MSQTETVSVNRVEKDFENEECMNCGMIQHQYYELEGVMMTKSCSQCLIEMLQMDEFSIEADSKTLLKNAN